MLLVCVPSLNVDIPLPEVILAASLCKSYIDSFRISISGLCLPNKNGKTVRMCSTCHKYV